MKHQIQHFNGIGLFLYIVFAALAVMCVLSPLFCIMPKFYAICVMASGACTILGMFYNRRVLLDTLKWTEEIDDGIPEEEPVTEEKPKKTTKKKGGK